jgi:Rrf2 family protein
VVKLEVTRMSDLAIRALIALDPPRARLKSGELAARLDATPAFMAQVMVPLVRRGWVDSAPGPNGGYLLGADLAELSVLDVIEAVEGPTDTGRCVVADGPCGGDGFCALHDAWARARAMLAEHLAATPVAEVAAGMSIEPTTGGDDDG